MAKHTKKDILFTAKTLFNTYGYNQVSLRDIADVLQISVGNLTYHFKRKEDIIESLIIDHYQNQKPFKAPQTFKELQSFFEIIEDHHGDSAYYYRHFRQLSRLSENIHNIQVDIQKSIYLAFHESFYIFQEKGYFKKEQHQNQYDSLIQMIMANNIFGAPYTGNFINEDLIAMYWDVLHLIFTDKGKQEYQKEILTM
ncbi:MAG: TetR/AcrR family transcriptional regulator [Breznakia sp.]